MYTIGQLCREFHLSRSTLLYYDSIGLLHAQKRTQGNYRQFDENDRQRLEKICAYREAGVKLEQIKELLDSKDAAERAILEKRLYELNQEIRTLRFRQTLIVEMLKRKNLASGSLLPDRQAFLTVLQSVGLDDETQTNLHRQFEKNAPDGHQAFLEFLGFSDEEIQRIRIHSKQENP
jgi:DNA-binding transcriptional MerR regulator